MATAKATKASDKAQICRRMVAALQKLYGKSAPRPDSPVLETFLFAICLEDNSWQDAQEAHRRLLGSYFDLNEIRVSSVLELEQSLIPLSGADWKGLQIRAILRHVFESTYSFDFEKFRRLTQEAAVKVLRKVPELSPFVRDFVVQHLLDSHLIPLDSSMLSAARWLGLVQRSQDQAAAAEYLKAGVRKSDVNDFCYLLRALATDSRFRERLAEIPEEDLDMQDAPERLKEIQLPPKRRTARRSADPAAAPATPTLPAETTRKAAQTRPEPKSADRNPSGNAKRAAAPAANATAAPESGKAGKTTGRVVADAPTQKKKAPEKSADTPSARVTEKKAEKSADATSTPPRHSAGGEKSSAKRESPGRSLPTATPSDKPSSPDSPGRKTPRKK